MRALLACPPGGGTAAGRRSSLPAVRRGRPVRRLRLLGLVTAGLVILLDQISKPLMRDWLSGGDIELTSFLTLVKAWNHGVGFSLLTMTLPSGPYILSALALAIAAGMAVWLFRVARAVPARAW